MNYKTFILLIAAILLGWINVYAQRDVTSTYITNATLSNGTNGWTNVNFHNPVRGNNTVGYACESYTGWNSLDITKYSLTQTVTLPKGNYTLVNYSFFRQGEYPNTNPTKSLAYLKAGERQVPIYTLGSVTATGYANSESESANVFDSKMYRRTLDFIIDDDSTSIEIGIEGTFDERRSWCSVGTFELIDNDAPISMASPIDVTEYISNSGFEYRDISGWTVTPAGYFYAQNNRQDFKVGGFYAEKWQPSVLPEGCMSQTIRNLPAGYYKLTANLGGNGTYVDVNGNTALWTADGDYTINCVLADGEDLTITAGKTAEGTANWIHFDNFKLYYYGKGSLLGDVNADGAVTLADGVCVASWLLEQEPPVFVESAADYNEDEVISVSDGVAIIQHVVASNEIAPDVPDEDVGKLLESFKCCRFMTDGFDLQLGALNDITALMMDVTLPDGLSLLSASLNGTHSIAVRQMGHNRFRIAVWSMDLASVGNGAVLHCKTSGGQPANIGIDHIRLVDQRTREWGATPVNCTPTGIHEVEGEAGETPRYTLDGKRSGGTPHGVYIQKGKKVIMK